MSDMESDCKLCKHCATAETSNRASLFCISCNGARTFDAIFKAAHTRLTTWALSGSRNEHAMPTLAWKILVCEVLLALNRARGHWHGLMTLMPPAVRRMRCARRMESLAARLTSMRRKISAFEASLTAGAFREAVDADFTIREMLKGLKEDIRHIRCEMAAVPVASRAGLGGQRLGAAIDHLHTVAEETYVAADRLLWEIGEHDLKYSCKNQRRPYESRDP